MLISMIDVLLDYSYVKILAYRLDEKQKNSLNKGALYELVINRFDDHELLRESQRSLQDNRD